MVRRSDDGNRYVQHRGYEYFIEKCKEKGIYTQTGEFGADMKVELLNDGPVTIMLEK